MDESMQEVIPRLWLGDIIAATNDVSLREKGIHSVLTAMQGELAVHPTFRRHTVPINDKDDVDVLVFLAPAIGFIQAELDKGRGVLVHCVAGVSRSATIVAAYLMYSRNIDATAALEVIRAVRPEVSPNPGFLRQLDIFYRASYNVSAQDKAIRLYYLERAVADIKSGKAAPGPSRVPDIPATTPAAVPAAAAAPRRRIRCKKCRHLLAGLEDMLGHNISPLAEPLPAAPPALPPPVEPAAPPVASPVLPLPSPGLGSRRSSSSTSQRRPSFLQSRRLSGLAMSALEGSALADEDAPAAPPPPASPSAQKMLAERERRASMDVHRKSDAVGAGRRVESDAEELARQLSDRLTLEEAFAAPAGEGAAAAKLDGPGVAAEAPASVKPTYARQADISARLRANVAALTAEPSLNAPPAPILANAKCSGYFVEPLPWMDALLASGETAGKLACPGARCGAKLGNFDWAGVKCGCGEWVVPGFCIARAKVDEVVG